MKWLFHVLGISWLLSNLTAILGIGSLAFVAGCLLAGCISGETIQKIASAGPQVIRELEEAGVDYEARIYMPGEFSIQWTPFGFTVRNPGGYVDAHIETGRGLGSRAPDTDLSYVQPPPDPAATPTP